MAHEPPYDTIEDALAVVNREARGVLSPRRDDVCSCCFGSKAPRFPHCFSCNRLIQTGAPRALMQRVVPVSMAISPGPWYNRMSRYKLADTDDMYLVAAAAYAAIEAYRSEIVTMLGGEIDAICVTPSTRGVADGKSLRLLNSLELIGDVTRPVESLLHHVTGQAKLRNTFSPQLFDGDRARIEGRRIILVDDTWVTGAATISAAATLQRLGASSLVIMPIARRIEAASAASVAWGPDYLSAVEARAWDANDLRWPRESPSISG